MRVHSDVNFEELARSTDEFNAAQLRAVCVEAGMIALREGCEWLSHEHFHSGIAEGMRTIPFLDILILIFFSAKQKEKGPHLLRIMLSSIGRLCYHSPYHRHTVFHSAKTIHYMPLVY